MHDSYLVPDLDTEVLKNVMRQVADENQLTRGDLKVSSSMPLRDQIVSILGEPTPFPTSGSVKLASASLLILSLQIQQPTLIPTPYDKA